MLWHPLLISITAVDVAILTLLLKAGITSFRIIQNWQPESSDTVQLHLEREAESAGIMVQWAFVLTVINSLMVIVAITLVLPRIVPGAMCGMGVMQAIGGRGYFILILRYLAFFLFFIQHALARINQTDPMSSLTVLLSRLTLLVLVFTAMAAYDTVATFLFHLNPTEPVSCCAVIYDQLEASTNESMHHLFQSSFWLILFSVITFIILTLSAKSILSRKFRQKVINEVLSILGLIWMITAVVCLIYFFAPYIYQVLGHHCPFCLFLPQHYGIGFFMFGLLLWVGMESPLPFFLYQIQAIHSDLSPTIQSRYRRSLLVLFWAVLGFCLLAGFPALLWRIRYGVWI
jgi:hypothetical protein